MDFAWRQKISNAETEQTPQSLAALVGDAVPEFAPRAQRARLTVAGAGKRTTPLIAGRVNETLPPETVYVAPPSAS